MPQAHVERRAPVGPFPDVKPVGALRCGRQRQQHVRLEVVKYRSIGGRFGVVELVDDHHVERGRIEVLYAQRVQRLDTGEHVRAIYRTFAADAFLAEARYDQRLSEGATRLIKALDRKSTRLKS